MEKSEAKPIRLTSSTKSTRTAKKVRGMVKRMYQEALEASARGQTIAYCFVAGIYDEIIKSMDIVPVFPENYAGLCAVKRDAERFLEKASAEGFPDCLCTYAACGLGFDAMRAETGEPPPNAPDGGMPKPDLALGVGSMVCDPRYKWFQALGRYVDVPTYVTDMMTPPVDANLPEVKAYYIRYIVEELTGLIEFLEKQVGRKMDWARLSEAVDTTEKFLKLLWKTYELRRAIPCPMGAQDHFVCFVPTRTMIGTKEALEFYQELYDEVKYRVDNKIGVIPNEKYRLLWGGGIPPWHTMVILDYLQGLGAIIPAETQYRPPDPPLEIPPSITNPLERLALRYFYRWTFMNESARQGCGVPEVEYLKQLVKRYSIDGVITHVSRTCRTWSLGQTHQLNVLREVLKVPSLTMESDMVDVQAYPEAQIKAEVDAFIDVVDAYKKKGN